MTRPWHLAHLLTTVFYFVYISHILVFCSINLSSMFGHVTVNHPEVEWMNLPWTCFIIWQPFGKWITEANNSLNTRNVCFVFQRLSVSCQNISNAIYWDIGSQTSVAWYGRNYWMFSLMTEEECSECFITIHGHVLFIFTFIINSELENIKTC